MIVDLDFDPEELKVGDKKQFDNYEKFIAATAYLNGLGIHTKQTSHIMEMEVVQIDET